jgi:hypothetical protein
MPFIDQRNRCPLAFVARVRAATGRRYSPDTYLIQALAAQTTAFGAEERPGGRLLLVRRRC